MTIFKSVSTFLLAITAGGAFGLFASSSARAENELISILEGSTGAASNQAGQLEQASALRKVIGAPTAEQNIFIQFFEKGELEKALFQWPAAFDGTEFGRSSSGRALNALLLFRNGIQVTALESLLAIEKPESIHSEVLSLWKSAAPATHDVWGLISNVVWKPHWTQTFGVGSEIRVRGRQVYGSSDLAVLTDLINKAQAGTKERAWLEWQQVIALSSGENPAKAAQALAEVMKASNNPVSQDLLTVSAARLLYQSGYLDAAVKYYEKVPKTSDYWFEAQEELAWAFVRKGEPQNSIAITRTLINPAFAAQVGPETLFLRSLAQLKICDYPEVVKTLNLFRDRYRDRAKTLLALSDKPDTEAVKSFVERAKNGRVKLTELGSSASQLPRHVTRDEVLAQLIQTQRALESEGKTAGELYARSLSGGTAQVGFQARLDQFRQGVESRVQSARSAMLNRVKILASEEVNEISQMLQKLHIVEAEVLQQISLANRVIGASGNQVSEKFGSTGSQSPDRIWFPADGETWFDELANYRVDVKKGCQSVKR